MEKNTILAIVLSSVVLIVSFVIQGVFFPSPQRQQAVQELPREPSVTAIETVNEPIQEFAPPVITPPVVTPPVIQSSISTIDELIPLQTVTINTELASIVLTNAGGDMVSFKWKDPRKNPGDEDAYVDLILSGNTQARAFSIAFGDLDTQPVSSNFHVNQLSPYTVEFHRDFSIPSADGIERRFRLIKRYDFKPNEYMFELTVTMDGGHSMPGFNFAGNAYTLSFGPQIGPMFEKLDRFYDYRMYNIYTNGKRRDAKTNESIDRPTWAAITGKYFAFVAIPYLAQYSLRFSEREEPGISSASRVHIFRPPVNVSKIEDTYRFYLGPKTQDTLAAYNTGKNDFGIRDANISEIANTRGIAGILSPLERLLKWLLLLFYGVVQNYGVAIILLTLLIKLVFFPLTKKGSEATIRMQALAPKIKELQEKHKGNPQKLQAEMANFYKQEGYNPLAGCLPMLLQLPIFITMYQLFNNHFDLRGAGFIPGWIPDLSVPEAIWNFPPGVQVPILGWTALRALPFIYVASQLLYGKVTQMPGQQSNTQMKMMLFLMPIVFFFILYDVPSGLLIYWIFSNLLTLVQQVIINKFIIAKKNAAAAAAAVEPVIAPPGKKKKGSSQGSKK
ncbi:MAG: membrane protein insertase YidC [Treponema sp.]|nr:membrane protein insertase YidC [Treponema sp.]